jgi:hypothetical protein
VRRAATLLASLALAGCIKFVEPAALAPSTVPIEPGTYSAIPGVGHLRGEADAIILFGIPIGDTSHTAARARNDALSKYGGADALIDVSVSYVTTIYFGIVTVTQTWVWGVPVRLNANLRGPAAPPAPGTPR